MPEDAEAVNATWPYSEGASTLEFIEFLSSNFPSVAVLHKESPVAWMLTYKVGAIGMLHVVEEHRSLGLAKYIIYKLSKKLLEMGQPAYLLVEENNIKSIDLHKKCGYSIDHACDAVLYKVSTSWTICQTAFTIQKPYYKLVTI